MPKTLPALTREAIAAARARGASVPRVSGVRYDEQRDAIVVEMRDGGFVGVPRTALRGPLARATAQQLSHVEIEGDGTCLFWPELEDGLDIVYVLERFVGIKSA